MKTATFLALLVALPIPAAYSQAAGAYAGAASQVSGSAQGAGRSVSGSTSQAIDANTNATTNATQRNLSGTVAGSANESAYAAGQAGKTVAGAQQASNLSAELTQKMDSKNAKVGDEVVARTTSTAQLAEGTRLPKGTRLMGKVTEVQSKSSAHRDGHLAFAFDRAIMRDGSEIPIHATLQSIAPPVSASAMGSGEDDFAASFAPVPVSAGGGGSVRGGGGGSLLGGGGAAAGGLVGGATSSVAATPGRAAGLSEGTLRTTEGTLNQTGSTLHQGAGLAAQTAGSTTAAVRNMPGLSASASASGSTMLDATGKNVELSSGTQMMFSVSKN